MQLFHHTSNTSGVFFCCDWNVEVWELPSSYHTHSFSHHQWKREEDLIQPKRHKGKMKNRFWLVQEQGENTGVWKVDITLLKGLMRNSISHSGYCTVLYMYNVIMQKNWKKAKLFYLRFRNHTVHTFSAFRCPRPGLMYVPISVTIYVSVSLIIFMFIFIIMIHAMPMFILICFPYIRSCSCLCPCNAAFHAAWTHSTNSKQDHAAWTCNMDMQAACTCSIDTWTYSTDMDMEHGRGHGA